MRKKLPLISGILNVLEKLKGNTGIIENTSVATHTIAAGKYVIWKNDLYKASSAISIGDTLSLSNLTAVSDGIANELNSNLPLLSNNAILEVVSFSNANFDYTATDDCFLFVCGDARSSQEINVWLGTAPNANTSNRLYKNYNTGTNWQQCSGLIPLKKGTTVHFTSSDWSNASFNHVFVYKIE